MPLPLPEVSPVRVDRTDAPEAALLEPPRDDEAIA